jgi:hypothetical protein
MSLGDHIKLSRAARLFLLFAFIVLVSNSLYRHYNRYVARQFVMSSDMEGYYQYLPYTFFKEKDITQMRWAKPYGKDKTLNVFTCGVAILELPFFLIAHGISEFLEMEERGYNSAYFMSVLFAAIFYVFIGLYYLFKALNRFFPPRVSFITVVLIFLATNLYYYTGMSPGMSHAYSFCLASIFIYFVPGFYEKPGFRSSLRVILPLALAVLIRPTTIVAGFYFLLYGVVSFRELGQRLRFLIEKWYLLLFMFIVSIVVFIPQMTYWHHVTGKWFVYSYQEYGFPYALNPKIGIVLFGARNGWYLYTPLMLLATLSLFYLSYKRKYNALAILPVIILIVYINSSWWRPTFSASAGHRAMIEFHPFMAIPLAYIIDRAHPHKIWRYLLGVTLILFIVHNVLFAYKYDGHLWWNTDWQWSYLLRFFQF